MSIKVGTILAVQRVYDHYSVNGHHMLTKPVDRFNLSPFQNSFFLSNARMARRRVVRMLTKRKGETRGRNVKAEEEEDKMKQKCVLKKVLTL